MSSNGKWSEQACHAANKGNKMLGMLRKTFTYWDSETAKFLYPSLIRPQLEYAMPVWNNFNKEDAKLLEGVQRRASRVCDLKGYSYEERLKELQWSSLDERRRRGDMIQTYKLAHKLDKITFGQDLFSAASESMRERRGHKLTITREIDAKDSCRSMFFTNRVQTSWNNLPAEIVYAPSVNSFKNKIDDFTNKVRPLSRLSLYRGK